MGVNGRTVASIRTVALITLLTIAGTACENPEEKARYVKEPFTASRQQDVPALNDAYREAQTRLASVRSDELRHYLDREPTAEIYPLPLETHENAHQRH